MSVRDTSVELHANDVRRRERFEFGKNWRRFLSTLTPARIDLAEQSLRNFLEMDRLDGFVAAAVLAALIGLLRGGIETPGRGLMVW